MTHDPVPSGDGDEGATPPGIPRWVKYLLITLALAALVMILAMLIGGGEHRPGRHALRAVDLISDPEPSNLVR